LNLPGRFGVTECIRRIYSQVTMEKLGNLYHSKSLVNKLFLRKKLYHLKMEDVDFVTQHLNAFNTLVSQLGSDYITLAEEDKCLTLLCSFPNSWDNIVVVIGSTT
jgi:hypothetical protein